MNLLTQLAGYVLSMQVEGIKKATQYVSEDLVVKITNKAKRNDRREKRVYTALTVGRPNYAERQFIKACKKAGEKLPVRKVQLRHFK